NVSRDKIAALVTVYCFVIPVVLGDMNYTKFLVRLKLPTSTNSTVVLGNKHFHISSVKEIREDEKNEEIIIECA
ncbi:unnamed protein product, partial [Allacma fusca]